MDKNTIFKRLLKGEIISPEDPESYKLKEASYDTKRLLLQMNNTSEPQKIRQFLSQIIDSEIDKSVTIFTPFHINYGKNTQIGKNVFINFDCVFLDLGGITIEDGVLIAPKVSLLSEGHPFLQNKDIHLFLSIFTLKKMLGLVQMPLFYME